MPDWILPLAGRWYSFLPWLVVSATAWRLYGWRRAVLLLVGGWAIAFAAEWGSTAGPGIPFGVYRYRSGGLSHDWRVLGVPLFDSLSFTWLAFCAFTLLGHLGVRGYRRVLLGAVAMVALDVVVDPVALRGAHWFLGSIYSYPPGRGVWFGVTLLNYVGWLAVGLALQLWLLLSLGNAHKAGKAAVVISGGMLFGVVAQSTVLAVLLGVAPAALACLALLALVAVAAWQTRPGWSALSATPLIIACALSAEGRAARAAVPGRWLRAPARGQSRWRHSSQPIEVWETGIGPDAARFAADSAITGTSVVVAGVAGACGSGWELGDTGVCESVLTGKLSWVALDQSLVSRLIAARVGRRCRMATVAAVADEGSERRRLLELGIQLVEMETAAWAETPGLSVAGVRVVLDTPEHPLGAAVQLLSLGARRPSWTKTLRLLVRRPGIVGELLKTGARQREALRSLKVAVAGVADCLLSQP